MKPSPFQAAFDGIFLQALRPMMGGLGTFFLVFVFIEVYTYPAAAVAPSVIFDVLLAVCLLAGWLAMGWWPLPARWAHAAGAAVVLVLLAKNLYTIRLLSDLSHTAVTAIILLAAGSLYLSTPWLVFLLVVALTGWSAVTLMGIDPPGTIGDGVSLYTAIAAALVIHFARMHTQRRIENLRREKESRTAETRRANEQLQQEIIERRRIEHDLREARNGLAMRIDERTAELRESEQRYRTLVENAPEAITAFDVDAGRFVDANENAMQMFKMTREELLRSNPAELSPPLQPDGSVSAEAVRRLTERALRGLKPRFEWIHCDAQRNDFPCEVSIVELPSQGRRLLRASVTDITERKENEQQLKLYSSRLKSLSQQLLATQEAERAHIARELHDEVGQSLTALMINLQSAVTGVDKSNRSLDNIAIVERLLRQVRDMSLDLRPSLLDDLGLITALRWFIGRQAQRAGWEWEFVTDLSDEQRLPPSLDTVCFRIVQEAMTNAARHANASRVSVKLARADGYLDLTIRDDGSGFAVEKAIKEATGGASVGLLGMQERALLGGGELTIHSAPGEGTEVRARFGLDRPTISPRVTDPAIRTASPDPTTPH